MPPAGRHPPAGIVSPVFVGRSAELAAVRALIERAENGESGVMLISGEAGVTFTVAVCGARARWKRGSKRQPRMLASPAGRAS